jgi:microcystin-dependent protein
MPNSTQLGTGVVLSSPQQGPPITLPQQSVDTVNLTPAVQQQLVPPGTVIDFAGPTAPTGYLICDGSAISQTVYANLYAAIGTYWGAPGGGNFSLPDMRGFFTRMVDTTAGARDPDYLSRTPFGTGTSDQVGSYQWHQFYSHDHPNWAPTVETGNGSFPVISLVINSQTSSTGYAGGNETRPINVYVVKCIKY